MDLETELTRLAHSLDRAAPSITADEALAGRAPRLVVSGPTRQRRVFAITTAALLVAASSVAAIALRRSGPDDVGSSLVIVDPTIPLPIETPIETSHEASLETSLETSTTNAVDPVPTTATKQQPVPVATATRVLLAGDSAASDVSQPLEAAIGSRVDSLQSVYKVSSGLTRPDFFDWPSRLRADIATANPTVSIVAIGGNDAQDILADGKSFVVDSPEWRAEYSRRVDEVLDILTADGRFVVWVGIPNAQHAPLTERLRIVERTTHQVVARRDGVAYIDTWKLFAGRNGTYVDHIIDPADGVDKPVRMQDGFHLNAAGSEILAGYIADAVMAFVPKSHPPRHTAIDRTLSLGMTGDDVRRVQDRLALLHFAPGPADGVFERTTRSAIWAFEKLVLGIEPHAVTGSLTEASWAILDGPINVSPRRRLGGTHVEIYLHEQVLVVFQGDEPKLISPISSGSGEEYIETVTISPGEEGNLNGSTPITKRIAGIAFTPGGTYTIDRRFADDSEWTENKLGRMYKPWYFNYGLAIHGAGNVPLVPASHGAVRVPMHVADLLPDLLQVGDAVYIWDGLKEPEEYGAQLPVFDRDIDALTPTTPSTP